MERLKANFKIKKKHIIILLIILLFLIFAYYQNNHLVTSVYMIDNDNIPETFDGYRIVQISDLHNKSFGKNNKKLINKIDELKPDIIVITGDVVDSNFTHTDVSINFIKKAKDIAPVYYVDGNHERWLDDKIRLELYDNIEKAGAVILDNQVAKLEIENEYINLLGLNDMSLNDSTINNLEYDKTAYSILLAHEPQYTQHYSKYVNLALTGHAHGGQFVLPFLGPLVAPDQGWFPEYTSGVHEIVDENYKMIVSRGLGNSIIPMRLFNYPEIVCIELKKK